MSYTKDSSTRGNFVTTTGFYNANYGTWTYSRAKADVIFAHVRIGDSNPRYKDQIAKHQNATTSMSAVSTDLLKARSITSWRSIRGPVAGNPHKFTVSGLLSAYMVHAYENISSTNPSIDSSTAYSSALNTAYKQIRDAYQSFNGMTFIGELGEAVHMLRHPAEGLLKAISDSYLDKLKKIKKRDPNRWKRAISQTWLEGCFGWRPLINDLQDAMKAYKRIQEQKVEPSYQKIKAVGKDDRLIKLITYGDYAPVDDFYHTTSGKIHEECTVVIRGECKNLVATTPVDKARVFGLSPNEFFPTAWELLPWSFLVDYFTNIGDIIAAGATDTSSVSWIEIATIKKRLYEASSIVNFSKNIQLKGSNLIDIGGKPDYFKAQRKSVVRSQLTGLSLPPFKLELPGSSIKQLNMLALWAQANSFSAQDQSKLRGRTFR